MTGRPRVLADKAAVSTSNRKEQLSSAFTCASPLPHGVCWRHKQEAHGSSTGDTPKCRPVVLAHSEQSHTASTGPGQLDSFRVAESDPTQKVVTPVRKKNLPCKSFEQKGCCREGAGKPAVLLAQRSKKLLETLMAYFISESTKTN